MRRAASFAITAVLAAMIQVGAPLAAQADVGAPVLTPADGAQLPSTDAVFTATYDTVAGQFSRIGVTDTGTGATVPCTAPVFFADGSHTLRCQVRDLRPGATLQATAVFRDDRNIIVRSDTWTVTVATPVPGSTWPASGQVIAGTVADPAPGPGQPATLDFDRALDPATTTARLFATDSGMRSAVDATVTVSGSTIDVEPAAVLAAGEYAIVASAVSNDVSQATTPETVEFDVGGATGLPTAPVDASPASLLTGLMSVYLSAPSGSTVGLVVYDPADPGVAVRTESMTQSACLLPGQTHCVRALLPVSGLAPGSYAWYADVRSGTLTRSTTDHPLELTSTDPPAAPANVVATGPASASDAPYMHVTADVGADVAAVLVTAKLNGTTLSRSLVVAPTAQQVDANIWMFGFADGTFTVTLTPFTGTGVAGTPGTATGTKESIPIAAHLQNAVIGPAGQITVLLNEDFRDESTLEVRDAGGALVAGLLTRYHPSPMLRFFPSQQLTTQTYEVHVVAYAATCTATDLSTCEQVDTTLPQQADATPDPATAITVTPRRPDPGVNTVVVAGRGTPGDAVRVAVSAGAAGTVSWSGTVGAADPTGTGTFDSGPMDLSPLPHTLQSVKVTTTDQVGNVAVTPAGTVDRRFPTALTASVDRGSTPWGTTVLVTGRLSVPATGHALAGTVSIVERRDDGSAVGLGKAKASATGTFSRAVVLTRSGTLRVRYDGATTTRPSLSLWTRRVAVGAEGTPPADHPATFAGARREAASRQGVRLSETIRSATDVDIYAFGVEHSGFHLIRLGHLLGDYTLGVYDRAGNRIAISHRNGTQFEEIYHFLAAGTYLVRVSSAHGWSATQPYHLSFRRLPDTVTLISTHIDRSNVEAAVVEVLNNTRQWRTTDIRVDCVNGTQVHEKALWVGVPKLPPRARRPFVLSLLPTCAAGSTLRLSPAYSTVTAWRPPAASYRIHHGQPFDAGADRQFPFTVTNTGTQTLRNLNAGLCAYDDEGRLVDVEGWPVEPLKPGASETGAFTLFSPYAHPNRIVFLNTFG